jgi:DNA-binding LacI/PurR family transcriptional regulator
MLRRSEPLARQIAAILRREIVAGFKAGQRLPAARELAARFGVNAHTVREGLSVLGQEGLIEGRPGSGTYVCDINKNRHVAVLAEWDISDPRTSYFYRRAPQQVLRFLRDRHVPVRLYTGHLAPGDDPPSALTCREFVSALERHRLCGVVAFGPHEVIDPWGEKLQRRHIPVVGGNQICTGRVVHDNAQIVRLGTDYLLGHGRRRLALMEYHWPEDRRSKFAENFQAALTGAGVVANERWIRRAPTPCAPQAGWEEFRAIWAEGREKPDGLLICNDNLFPGAVMAILQLGIRVPEDLLVVTHFNKGSGMISPFPVAKVQMDPEAYARAAAEMLLQLMRHEPVEKERVIPYELVETPGAAASGESETKRRYGEGVDGHGDARTRGHGDAIPSPELVGV